MGWAKKSGERVGPTFGSQRGVALVTVLLALAVLLGLGLAGLSLALTYRELSNTELRSLEAFYAAEAGLNAALAVLASNWSWPGYPGGALPPEAALLEQEGARIQEVKIQDLGGMLQIEARGEAGGRTRRVAAWVQKPAWAYGLLLGTTDPVTIGSNSELHGTLVFQGSVTNRGKVFGTIIAGGEVENEGPGDVEGSVKANAAPGLPGFIPPNVGKLLLTYSGATVVGGDCTLGEQELQQLAAGNGFLVVNGNVRIVGQPGHGGNKTITYAGRAVIAATSDITIETSLLRTGGQESLTSGLFLLADGNITIDGNYEVHAVLWTGSNLKVHSQTKIVGAVAAWNLDRQGEADPKFELFYDQGLVSLLLGSGSPLPTTETCPRIVRWWVMGS